MNVFLVIAIWQWFAKRVLSFDWIESNPVLVRFANVYLLAYGKQEPIARLSYFNGTKTMMNPFRETVLTPIGDKSTLRMQRQKSIPQLATIRLNGNRVGWENNRANIDNHIVTRDRKTSAKTGKAYTVGFWHAGIRYERLSDCLNRLEQMYTYTRGNWVIA